MIAFVHGMAVDMTESSVVVEAGGIGYEIYMTGADLSEIRMGEDVKVHTYFSVREDAMKLYGFRAKDDLQMFKLLLGVNGVGPKAALGVLAGITADELRFAILSDDVKTLSKAPGIGKKTAQKLILELKDKMKPFLESARTKENIDMLFLLLTDILSENSYVIYAGAEAENILSQGFNQMPVDGEALLEGVVSRKKQFVPVMMGMLMA
mgnify:CR=1 FL=1